MAQTTGISWTDHTFNPWWGCVKVSPACTNCYAERDSKRYGHDVWGSSSRRRFFSEKHWQEPLKWNKKAAADGVRRRVFCASMADVFEVLPDGHPDAEQMTSSRDDLMVLICETPSLDWLLLTKRPEEMARYFSDRPVPDNVIAMTTAENQEWLDKRINHLLAVPARRRGLSLEPLLGPIRLDQCAPHILGGDDSNPGVTDELSPRHYRRDTADRSNGQWCSVGDRRRRIRTESATYSSGLAPLIAQPMRDSRSFVSLQTVGRVDAVPYKHNPLPCGECRRDRSAAT